MVGSGFSCPRLPYLPELNVSRHPRPRGVLNRGWRIFATGLSFVLFGLGAVVLGLIFSLLVFPLPLGRVRKQIWARRSMQRALWIYVRIMRGLGLLTFEFRGNFDPSLDGEGCLVVANHPSLLDVVFLISAFPDINCIVKSALWRNPLTVAIVTMAGYIRNDTEDLLEVAASQIESGQMLVVFPEGTRTVDPEALDFKRGALHIAVAAACPILPVHISCEPPTLRKHQPWYDVPDTPPHFALEAMPVINVVDTIDTSQVRSIQVRHLTRWLLDYFQRLVKTA